MAVLIESSRDALFDTLMRPRTIVVVYECGDEAMQLTVVEDEYMVQAFSFEAADESLAMSVGFGRSERCPQFFYTTTGSNGRELPVVLAVPIVNQVLVLRPKAWFREAVELSICRWER